MNDFFHMGGYAFYVWGAYALALVILLANFILPIRQQRKLLREVARAADRTKRSRA